jgi:hypothetical protein
MARTSLKKRRQTMSDSSSTLDPDNIPAGADQRRTQKGHDTKSLGSGDASDTGSDMAGPSTRGRAMDDNTDRAGTGERSTVGTDANVPSDADRDADRIVREDEAGLGGGLDQAEEARLGKTDEQIEEEARNQAGLVKTPKPRK